MFSIKIQVLPTDLFHHEQAEDVKISTKADHEKKNKSESHTELQNITKHLKMLRLK